MDDKRSTVQVFATFSVVKKLAPHLEAEIRALNTSVFRLEGIAIILAPDQAPVEAITKTADPVAVETVKKSSLANRILRKGK